MDRVLEDDEVFGREERKCLEYLEFACLPVATVYPQILVFL